MRISFVWRPQLPPACNPCGNMHMNQLGIINKPVSKREAGFFMPIRRGKYRVLRMNF